MKFFRYMWVGPSLDDQRKEVFRKMKKHQLSEDTYVLAISEKGTGKLMDIYQGDTISDRYFKKSKQVVIGISGSYDEAVELAGGIIGRVYQKTGGFDIQKYLDDTLKEVRRRG